MIPRWFVVPGGRGRAMNFLFFPCHMSVSDARNGQRRKNGRRVHRVASIAVNAPKRTLLPPLLPSDPSRPPSVVFVMEIAAHFPPLGIVSSTVRVHVPSHRPSPPSLPDAALAPGLTKHATSPKFGFIDGN